MGILICLAAALIVCAACNGESPADTISDQLALIQSASTESAKTLNPDEAPGPGEKLSSAEAIDLISQRFQYEDQGDVTHYESVWADGVELYRFELHWYGDAIHYYGILVNSHTGAMEVEEI